MLSRKRCRGTLQDYKKAMTTMMMTTMFFCIYVGHCYWKKKIKNCTHSRTPVP